MTKSLLQSRGILYIKSLKPTKESISKLQMGKLRLTELTELDKVQNYFKKNPKTEKALPLWTSLEHVKLMAVGFF